MTDLAGTQISSLMETLPGIAHVLRSPVADAFVNLIRAGSTQTGFNLADAEEVMKYAVRRNLLANDEAERILAEAREALAAAAAAAKAKAPKAPANSHAAPARQVARKPAVAKKAPKAPAPKKRTAKPAPRKAAAKPTGKKPARPSSKKPAPKK